ncbi:MAG TPA: cytochrome c oxidase subunit 3 [Steroidobacteraceae bacterium]|nr:cytochrome c oxidase subunit 3 [Steroidobacteraceae bacterium]
MSAAPLLRHPGINLGPAHPETETKSGELLFGFWVFLMSDAIVFGLLFATYAAMLHARAGGPGPAKLYDIRSAFIETLALLSSSFTYGMASLALKYGRRQGPLLAWLAVTLCLGGLFLGLEVHDFLSMFRKAAGPDRSGFLSAFFALVPLHGLHVTSGIVWMIALIAQIRIHGVDRDVKLGLLRLGLFWHFLDIVWVAIFTVIYLGGLA